MDTYKTSAKDFKVFARAVKKWQKKMGLERWSIFVNHKNDEEDPDGDCAWLLCDYESLISTICLAVDWPVKPTAGMLDTSAFHECRHLLYAPILEMIPKTLQKLARQEEHRLIVSDERLAFGKALSEYGVNNDA